MAAERTNGMKDETVKIDRLAALMKVLRHTPDRDPVSHANGAVAAESNAADQEKTSRVEYGTGTRRVKLVCHTPEEHDAYQERIQHGRALGKAASAVSFGRVQAAVAGLDAARGKAASKNITIDPNLVTVAVRRTRTGKLTAAPDASGNRKRSRRKVKRIREPSTTAGNHGSPVTFIFRQGRFQVATWWPVSGALNIAGRPFKGIETIDQATDLVLAAV